MKLFPKLSIFAVFAKSERWRRVKLGIFGKNAKFELRPRVKSDKKR
jgi:hypothetical protein